MDSFVCAECGERHAAGHAWRVTLTADHFSLSGEFLGDMEHLRHWAKAQEPYGLVTATPLDEGGHD